MKIFLSRVEIANFFAKKSRIKDQPVNCFQPKGWVLPESLKDKVKEIILIYFLGFC